MKKILPIFILLLFLYNCSNNQTGNNDNKESANISPDRYVDIGTHRVHINDFGKGSPVVVFVGGCGGRIDQWQRQIHEIDKYTRSIAYDRAGLGNTENINKPRSIKSMTDELALMLEKEEIPGPYVLVAHSLGGMIIRYYNYLYPEKVAGLVFVDALGDDSYDMFENWPDFKQEWIDVVDNISDQYPGGIADEYAFCKTGLFKNDTLQMIGYPKNTYVRIISSMVANDTVAVLNKQRQDSLFQILAKNDSLIEYIPTYKSGHAIHSSEPVMVNNIIIDLIKEIKKE